MNEDNTEEYRRLYRAAWQQQNGLFESSVGEYLLRMATPVLAFGRWQVATLATVGLNPSPLEFLDKGRLPAYVELRNEERRFRHRSEQDPDVPDDHIIEDAHRLASGYFELGREYTGWFDGFAPFMKGVDFAFHDGSACHTDYVSPFATAVPEERLYTEHGRKRKVPPKVFRELKISGSHLWRRMLDLMPNLSVVLGMGAGYRSMPDLFNFDDWDGIEYFDAKNIKQCEKPYLRYRLVEIGARPVHLFWWIPHFGDPIGGLKSREKRILGELVAEIAGVSASN